MVVIANRLAIAGIAVLGLSMTGVMFLVSHVMFGETAAILAAASAGMLFALLWVVMPLVTRRHAARG